MTHTIERQGDWVQTYTGRAFWPFDPRPEEVDIADIAHALSMQCRYAGHCSHFYSVGEHSVWCALMALMPNADFIFCKSMSSAVGAAISNMRMGWTGSASDRLQLALAALMHDAAEAYLVDLPRPVKRSMPIYRSAEEKVERAIAERYGLANPMSAEVKEIDERMLATEAAILMGNPPNWSLSASPYWIRGDLLGNQPPTVRVAFEELFSALTERPTTGTSAAAGLVAP